MILAGAALLSHGGDAAQSAGRAIREACLEAVGAGLRTADLGGHLGTSEFTDEVIARTARSSTESGRRSDRTSVYLRYVVMRKDDPPTNPFTYGALALDDAFTNRETELRDLVADMENGQDVVLYAPRRYGKSSLVIRAIAAGVSATCSSATAT